MLVLLVEDESSIDTNAERTSAGNEDHASSTEEERAVGRDPETSSLRRNDDKRTGE